MRPARKLFISVFLGLSLSAASCTFPNPAQRVQGYLLTYYSMPRKIKIGESRIGLRVQDRDYRIVAPAAVSLVVIDPEGNSRPALALSPGQGRDFRVRLDWPLAGQYRLDFQVTLENPSNPLRMEFKQLVSK